MKSAYRALIWEQNRVAAPATGMCFLAFLAVLLTSQLDSVRMYESGPISVVAMLGTALVLLLRNNHESHLVTEFERRLARLPLKTLGIVLVPLSTRLSYLLLFALASLAAHLLLMGQAPSLHYYTIPFVLYLGAQAYTWSRRSITGTTYAVPLILLLLPIPLSMVYNLDYWEAAGQLIERAFQPLPALLLGTFFAGVAIAGVYLERRDARVGLPTLRELWEWLNTRDASPSGAFASALDAQLWYEQKRMGRMLPLLTLLLSVVLCLLVLSIARDPHYLLRWMPPLALGLAALPVGLTGLWPRSNFELLRPQDHRTLARAKVLAIFQSILASTVVGSLLMLLIVWSTPERTLHFEALQNGEVSLWNLPAIVFGPVLLAAACAWFLIAGRRIAALSLVLGGVWLAVLLTVVSGLNWLLDKDIFSFISLLTLLVAIFGVCLGHWLRALHHEVMSRRTLYAILVLWLALAGCFWIVGPKQLSPLGAPLISLFFSALLTAPLVTLPLEVAKRRVQ